MKLRPVAHSFLLTFGIRNIKHIAACHFLYCGITYSIGTLAVPEQVISVCNGYMIHKYYQVSRYKFYAQTKKNKKIGTFWTSTSHCGKDEMNETMNKLKKNCLQSN